MTSIHKRGATFDRHGPVLVFDSASGAPVQVTDLTGWVGKCQVRDGLDRLIDDCTFTWVDATQGLARIFVDDTSAWPVTKQARIDIMLRSPGGAWISTPTALFDIQDGVTDRWVV